MAAISNNSIFGCGPNGKFFIQLFKEYACQNKVITHPVGLADPINHFANLC